MPDVRTALVSDGQIRTLREDGAVALRGVFDAAWIEMLRGGVEETMSSPGPFSKDYAPPGEGKFFTDHSMFLRLEPFRRFAWGVEIMRDTGGDPERRARLQERLGDAMWAGRTNAQRGIDHLEEALATYVELADEGRAARVHSRLGRVFSGIPFELIDMPRATRHFDAALEVLGRDPDSTTLGALLFSRGAAFMIANEPHQGVAACREALRIATLHSNEILEAGARALLGNNLGLLGQL